jgi:hypothetical protein
MLVFHALESRFGDGVPGVCALRNVISPLRMLSHSRMLE